MHDTSLIKHIVVFFERKTFHSKTIYLFVIISRNIFEQLKYKSNHERLVLPIRYASGFFFKKRCIKSIFILLRRSAQLYIIIYINKMNDRNKIF